MAATSILRLSNRTTQRGFIPWGEYKIGFQEKIMADVSRSWNKGHSHQYGCLKEFECAPNEGWSARGHCCGWRWSNGDQLDSEPIKWLVNGANKPRAEVLQRRAANGDWCNVGIRAMQGYIGAATNINMLGYYQTRLDETSLLFHKLPRTALASAASLGLLMGGLQDDAHGGRADNFCTFVSPEAC